MGFWDSVGSGLNSVFNPTQATNGGPIGLLVGSGRNDQFVPDPPPQIPGYVSPEVAPVAVPHVGAPNIDQSGLNAYRNLALGDMSPWTSAQMSQNAEQTTHLRDQANTAAQSGTNSAWDRVAMGGGLRSGAAERIAESGQQAGALAGQNASEQGAARDLAIQTSGRQQQLQALQNLPGMEIAAAQPGTEVAKFNAGNDIQAQQYGNQNALAKASAQNEYNQGNYGIQSQIYGGTQLANEKQNEYNNRSLWNRLW